MYIVATPIYMYICLMKVQVAKYILDRYIYCIPSLYAYYYV